MGNEGSTNVSFSFDEELSSVSFEGRLDRIDMGPLINSFRYLNAERIGPRKVQIMAPSPYLEVGYQGENTNYAIYQADKSHRPISPKLLAEESILRFSAQAEVWLQTIIPGVQLKTTGYEDVGMAGVMYRNGVLDTGYFSPPNTGFGISYVLPIIVASLLSSTEEKPILIIENPEAHLHPLGQSRIGRFLSLVAQSGVQVIVETHSEHVVNGARIQMAQNNVSEKLLINVFSEKYNKVLVDSITSNKFGELSAWPSGFFDQEQKDLREILRLKI